jgi:hypothetical protein
VGVAPFSRFKGIKQIDKISYDLDVVTVCGGHQTANCPVAPVDLLA